MLEQVFLNLIKDDFIKAIEKHAKALKAKNEDIQIRIKFDVETGLSYAICQQWKVVKDNCSFKDVMCIKLDVFNKEAMLSPHIYEMLVKQVTIYNANAETFSAFLYERHKTICCSLHDGIEYKRSCLLNDLFTQ